jgi:hypothetical protein
MRRREFIALLGGTAFAWPEAVFAQQSDKPRLIGVLMGFASDDRKLEIVLRHFAMRARGSAGAKAVTCDLLRCMSPLCSALLSLGHVA